MAYVNGSDLLLKVKIGTTATATAVGHCSSHTINYTSETKDRAVKPVATAAISDGVWKEKGVTGLSYSIDAEGYIHTEENETAYPALLAAWESGKAIVIEAYYRSNTSPYLVGSCVITDITENSPAEDDATYSIKLENNGAPTTFDPTKCAPASE